jgi:hypothetical protein
MKNSSLDAEPPSKFAREKEVNKKRNETFSPLVVFLGTEKSKNKITDYINLEGKVISDRQKQNFDVSYLINEESFSEDNLTLTSKNIEFINKNISSNNILLSSHYAQNENNTEFTRKDVSRFYDMTSPYSFIPKIKEENKKEELSPQFREQEIKEPTYVLHNLDEEPKQES